MSAWRWLVASLLLLAWDLSGADLLVLRQFGGLHGFPLREAFVPSVLLHQGGRWLAAAALAGWALWAALPVGGPPRRERWAWLAVAVATLVAVPLFKQGSSTSCPWEWAEFGGQAQWVSHWRVGVSDGGTGHCFPSGHAAAAFAFLPGYFMLRRRHRAAAWRWLATCLLLGALFGGAQVVRGAHPPSHVLWTAWLCAALAAGAEWVRTRTAQPFADDVPHRPLSSG